MKSITHSDGINVVICSLATPLVATRANWLSKLLHGVLHCNEVLHVADYDSSIILIPLQLHHAPSEMIVQIAVSSRNFLVAFEKASGEFNHSYN